jgi:hypothetical protein
VKNLCHVVSLSYEGYEEQMWALFIAIEANRDRGVLASTSNFSVKQENIRKRELKCYTCSINYDAKGGQSQRAKGKGRGQPYV